MTLNEVKGRKDIVSLFHTELIRLIPAELLDEISEAILIDILKKSGQSLPDPLDAPVGYIYNTISKQITWVDYRGVVYGLNK